MIKKIIFSVVLTAALVPQSAPAAPDLDAVARLEQKLAEEKQLRRQPVPALDPKALLAA